MEKLIELRKEFGLEGAELLAFVEEREEKEEIRQEIEERENRRLERK